MVWKISPFVLSYILGLLGNILTANEKYPLRQYENLLTPVQMQLSLKLKSFWIFFFHFWKIISILNIYKKKMIVIPTFCRKLQTLRNLVRPRSKKHRFKNPFYSQHVQGSQILVKCALEDFHSFFHHCERTWFGKFLP